jgi:ABC-2 type transport system permease protein
MKAFTAMLKKEIMEAQRSYKLMILLIVFIIFGISSPVVAKIMPDILGSMLPEGMTIEMPEPTAADSFAQFFKNVSQMGYIVLVILFSGITAGEISKGTLINLLSKGLDRKTVILSKFSVAALLWTAALGICLIITCINTSFFWSMDGLQYIFTASVGLWLYGLLLISLTILGGVVFGNIYGSLLFTGGGAVVFMLLNLIKGFKPFGPATLSSSGLALITSAMNIGDYYPAMLVCAGIIFAIVVSSILVFDKKQL